MKIKASGLQKTQLRNEKTSPPQKECKKIFANHAHDGELMPRIHKEISTQKVLKLLN